MPTCNHVVHATPIRRCSYTLILCLFNLHLHNHRTDLEEKRGGERRERSGRPFVLLPGTHAPVWCSSTRRYSMILAARCIHLNSYRSTATQTRRRIRGRPHCASTPSKCAATPVASSLRPFSTSRNANKKTEGQGAKKQSATQQVSQPQNASGVARRTSYTCTLHAQARPPPTRGTPCTRQHVTPQALQRRDGAGARTTDSPF